MLSRKLNHLKMLALASLLASPALAATYPEIDFAGRPSYIPNNVVVLTFDDAPDYTNTETVLNVLKNKNAKATFFLNSENWSNLGSDDQARALVRRMVSDGHTLANHSAHHLHLPSLDNADLESEIKGVEDAVKSIFNGGGPRLTLFRAPYGDPYQNSPVNNPNADYLKVAPTVAKHAVHVGWSIDPGDFDCREGDSDCVFNHVKDALKTPGNGDYGIILMHSVWSHTAGALPRIIDYIRANGFVIWSVEDVVKARYGKTSGELIGGSSTGGGTTNPPVTGPSNSLVSRYSNKCLDVTDNGLADGAKMQQWACAGSNNQKFRLQAVSNGIYNVVNVQSGKCLDVTGVSNANGAAIQQWACSANSNQQVRLTDSVNGSKILRFLNSNKCLDINGPSLGDGAKLHQWDCHGGASQDWYLRP